MIHVPEENKKSAAFLPDQVLRFHDSKSKEMGEVTEG